MSNYAPKTTEWMRKNNWGAEAQQLVTADLHSCESCLAEAVREVDRLKSLTRALIRAGDALYVKGKFADQDYWAPCNWATVVEESDKLLTPSGEAGKGGGV